MSAQIQPDHLIANRYRLLSAVGRGGMGTVWRAQDELLGRLVAIKEVIAPAGASGDEERTLRERTLREARTAARLGHPNVVTIYDVVEDGDRPWIVMEFVDACSLRELIEADGPLSPRRTAEIGLQVLSALEAAHELGIAHRDVKPGNVLIDGTGRAVLADFGIARSADSPSLTRTGMIVGSAAYTAPERAHGDRGGAASDLWSLGATLYTAVEGRAPYQREGALATLMAVTSADPDPPRLAGQIWPVLEGLLRKDPRERLSSAAAERMLRAAAGTSSASGPTAGSADRQATSPMPGSARGSWHDHGALAKAERTSTFGSPPGSVAGAAGTVSGAPSPASTESPSWAARKPATAGAAAARSRRLAGRGRSVVLACLAALIVCAAAAVALDQAIQPAKPAAGASNGRQQGSGQQGNGQQGSGQPGNGGGHRRGAGGTHASGPTTPPSGDHGRPSGSPGAARLPPDYHRYQDSTGFSIGVPDGWAVSHRGHYVYITPPSGPMYLLIDQTTHPKSDPLADWQAQEAARRGTYPDYHRIRLQAVSYPQAERAADWEFTFVGNGGPTHVLNRNVLANSQHAYALYWSTPSSQWTASYHYFAAFVATFRPASGPGGAGS